MNTKIVALILTLVGCCLAQQAKETYKAFNYNWDSKDVDGNVMSEERSQDAQGRVSGTFLYQLVTGIFRTARYEATPEGGFRITIDSNEPGMGQDSPANAVYNIQDPPAGAYGPPKRR